MSTIWDIKADAIHKGDKLRNVSPLIDKNRIDEKGFTHYGFSMAMFNNPWYDVPNNDLKLFKKFFAGNKRI